MTIAKTQRQAKITEIVGGLRASSQEDLLQQLKASGLKATQATVSRDLAELGVVKVEGVYRLPRLRKGQSALLDELRIETAGKNLIVLKTPAGQASVAALAIDEAGINEVAGTLAGDDTVFIAVKNALGQRRVIKRLLGLF